MKEWPIDKLITHRSNVKYSGGWDNKYFMCGGPTGEVDGDLSQFYYKGEIRIKFGTSYKWKGIITKIEVIKSNVKSGWHDISDYREVDFSGYVDDFYKGMIHAIFTRLKWM